MWMAWAWSATYPWPRRYPSMLQTCASEHEERCEREDERARTESQLFAPELRDDQWSTVRRMMKIPAEALRRAASPKRTQRLVHALIVGLLPPLVQGHRGDHDLSCPHRACERMVTGGINEAE